MVEFGDRVAHHPITKAMELRAATAYSEGLKRMFFDAKILSCLFCVEAALLRFKTANEPVRVAKVK